MGCRLAYRNNTGMALMTVLVVIMVMSIFVITHISQNLSQATSVQAQIDQIYAQQFATGVVAKAITDLNVGRTPSVEDRDDFFFFRYGPSINSMLTGTQYTATASF